MQVCRGLVVARSARHAGSRERARRGGAGLRARRGAVLPLLLAACWLAGTPEGARAEPSGGAHPTLDDGGVLRWHVTYAAAQQAAAPARRAVLVVLGRADDEATRALITRVIPDARVRARLSALCVGLAVDDARPDPGVRTLFRRNLPEGGLPAVAMLTAEGRWLTGYRGPTAVETFLQHVAFTEGQLGRGGVPGPGPGGTPDGALPPPEVRPARPAAPPALPDAGAERERLPTTLVGSPDGAPAAVGPSGAAPAPVLRPGLGEPAVERRPGGVAPSSPPTTDGRCSSVLVRTAADVAAARRAAEAGRWSEVLRLARGSEDLRLLMLEREARAWAQSELERCLGEALAGRGEAALSGLRRVQSELGDEPLGIDAARGYEAVADRLSLDQLADPRGVFAETLRRNRYDQLRGSRWARLFQPAAP